MINILTSKNVALVALSLSIATVATAQDATSSETSGTGSAAVRSGTGPVDAGATGTGTTSLPTSTGSGGYFNSGTTYPAPTASPSATPGYYDSGSTSSGNSSDPALSTTDGIPAGTGSMSTGPNAPSGDISSPQSVPVPNTGTSSGTSGSGM